MTHERTSARGDADKNAAEQTPVVSPAVPFVARDKGRRWPRETWIEIGGRYIAGETAQALALEYGMTPQAIYQQARNHGWVKTVVVTAPRPDLAAPKTVTPDELAPPPAKRRIDRRLHHTPEAVALAIEAHLDHGWTQSAIQRAFAITPSRLAAEKRRLGVTKTARAIGPPDITLTPPVPPDAPPWETVAHPAQIAPAGAWSTWLFQGGRGAGKTRAGAEWLAAQAAANTQGIFALVGATIHDVREVMIEGPAGLMNLPGRAPPKFEASRRRLIFPGGAVAYAFSSEEPRRLRGPQFNGAWADEFCAWQNPHDTLANLRLGLRRGDDPRLVITTTPRPMRELRLLRAERSCVLTQAPSAVNAHNLSPRFLEGLHELYGGTDLARQELEGELLERDSRGVWTAETLRAARGARPHAFDRIVVAVDPPAGRGGSACGIVAAGRLGGRVYVLADRSARDLSPLAWASRAAQAARDFGADAIVAESNQGGEMVRATIAAADPPCRIDLERARYGKRERAAPVSTLYERGLVTHCGAFALLEEEMMALDGGASGSFDRVDALVWALTVLMFDPREGFSPGLRQL
jgi:phage terminase large subunit-like protein